MRTRAVFIALVLSGLTASACLAGDSLSIRLIKASNTEKGGLDESLADVAPMLKKTLSYNTYNLVATGVQPLPADGKTIELGGLGISCLGKKLKLHIAITKDNNSLLKTDVNLPVGKPFVLGGIPSGKDTLLLVFLVTE